MCAKERLFDGKTFCFVLLVFTSSTHSPLKTTTWTEGFDTKVRFCLLSLITWNTLKKECFFLFCKMLNDQSTSLRTCYLKKRIANELQKVDMARHVCFFWEKILFTWFPQKWRIPSKVTQIPSTRYFIVLQILIIFDLQHDLCSLVKSNGFMGPFH